MKLHFVTSALVSFFQVATINGADERIAYDAKIGERRNMRGTKANHKEGISVDYLVIGAGAGGLNTAMDLGESLASIGKMNDDSVLIIEASDHVGGRHEQIDVVKPDGYNGPKLTMGVGGMRTNPTLQIQRRLSEENEIKSYCSAFGNHIFARGRSARCEDPPQSGCDIFTAFCSNDPKFIDKTQVDETPYGSAFNLEGIASTNADPESAALKFMLEYDNVNPSTGETCNNDDSNPAKKCAKESCKYYVDYSSFLQGIFGLEYAEFISLGNVGFLGDQGTSINACRYLDWFQREFDTTSINCYPDGGLQAIDEKMLLRSQAVGVKIMYNEPAITINATSSKRSKSSKNSKGGKSSKSSKGGTSNNQSKYVVQTVNHTINVRKFLFVAINTDDIRGGKVSGDFIDAIETQKPFQQPKGSSVATVAIQWDPNTPAWFLDELDKTGGSYSYRQFGDIDCFSRAEFIDTPYMRQQNTIRAVYSDYRCLDLWKELIEAADSGNPGPLKQRVLDGLRLGFPGRSIPDPVLVKGKLWESAWYFSDPLNDSTVDELADFASEPILGESACLIGDSYASLYNAWTEGAFQASRKCLTDRFIAENGSEFDAELGNELGRRHDDRDSLIAPFDFGAPGTDDFEIGAHEIFAPFGCLYNEDGSLVSELTSGASCGAPACAA
uniref:Amine oxidase domain-containing protein n=1 Tax=Chaetoceros debilis TaxID=122233 RepID=A0A7S3V7E1_9STRA|mmetsp:Transcript_13345/g.19437  ORF Transcript_13345/g.19437 Transcript_13345/m.19437 type:complete len:669 (+) Transcript_13345:102-2108(+)